MNVMQSLKFTELPLACSAAMEWARVPGYSRYFVSEYGDVVCAGKNRRLKGFMDYDGYPSYKLTDDCGESHQVSAHRLVAVSFLPPPKDDQHQIRHMNGSRLFAHKSNIAWGSAMDNRTDTRAHGTSPSQGERNPKAKITANDVVVIRAIHRDIKEGRSTMRVGELASSYGLHISTVCGIASGKSWAHVR